jgi:trans-2,3-dihydro-3-hydroxyanthranilate isomerase
MRMPTTLTYRLVNVFTENRGALTGNPLCVFESGEALSGELMQALARQFNLSETTFILPSTTANAKVRIFTPAYEMPFAGHPTLGTAHVCRALELGGNELKLEMRAGIIPVSAHGDRWTLQANAPTWRECEAPRSKLAEMLGLRVDDIGERPLWVKAGKEQLVIPLKSEKAVRSVQPLASIFGEVVSEDGHGMAYVFAELGGQRLLSRFFFPAGSTILEDPATGSATANLGGWMIAMQRPKPVSYTISQGEYLQRPSTLFLDVDAAGRILVGGDVIELGGGTLRV